MSKVNKKITLKSLCKYYDLEEVEVVNHQYNVVQKWTFVKKEYNHVISKIIAYTVNCKVTWCSCTIEIPTDVYKMYVVGNSYIYMQFINFTSRLISIRHNMYTTDEEKINSNITGVDMQEIEFNGKYAFVKFNYYEKQPTPTKRFKVA